MGSPSACRLVTTVGPVSAKLQMLICGLGGAGRDGYIPTK
ncbi:hypothetical protein thalar_01067 [Litoreibacter arenae DSM 19593]|uniref:Uncharacterized protein n=1 Tax=Litoreibacter arenae DSM 19593 TaxID=1123360 RepID=S9RS05_9RHOB|nr:hypothetical protein thalar_01067 [Litoreibacter arenae DSM 19593]